MLIQATSLNHNLVRSLEDQKALGRIQNILVDPDNGQVIAFILQHFFGDPKIISPMDIVGYSPGIIMVKNEELVLPIKEVIRAEQIWKKKIKLIGSTCKTESGKILGTIDDFLLDLENMLVLKYYINGNNLLSPFAPNRIILANKTVKIEKGLVVVQDEEEQMAEKELVKATNN